VSSASSAAAEQARAHIGRLTIRALSRKSGKLCRLKRTLADRIEDIGGLRLQDDRSA
jgi:hypothetical protein